jgi:hypothetical protein
VTRPEEAGRQPSARTIEYVLIPLFRRRHRPPSTLKALHRKAQGKQSAALGFTTPFGSTLKGWDQHGPPGGRPAR